jgi:hypothetical protein
MLSYYNVHFSEELVFINQRGSPVERENDHNEAGMAYACNVLKLDITIG